MQIKPVINPRKIRGFIYNNKIIIVSVISTLFILWFVTAVIGNATKGSEIKKLNAELDRLSEVESYFKTCTLDDVVCDFEK